MSRVVVFLTYSWSWNKNGYNSY